MPPRLENTAVAIGLEKVTFIPILKNGNTKECSNYHTIVLISRASKVMLKILQARLQQYVNQKVSDVQAGFRKGRGARDQIPNIRWTIPSKGIPGKHLLLLHWLCYKAFDCVDQNKLWKILKDMRIPDHLTCLLRNLYADQEATVRSFQDGGGWVVDRKAEGPYEVKRAENHPLPHFSQPQEPSRSPAEAWVF